MKNLLLIALALFLVSCSDRDDRYGSTGYPTGPTWGTPYFNVVDNKPNKLVVTISGSGYAGVQAVPVNFNYTSLKTSVTAKVGSSGSIIQVKGRRILDKYEYTSNSYTVDGAMVISTNADVTGKVEEIYFDIPGFTGEMTFTIECYSRDGVILP